MDKTIPIYQVDAFARRLFGGNPAAVCPLEEWLDDSTLQAIAEENNLSETAFFVPGPGRFPLRWFTPKAEIDLCGHATLATAHVLFEHLGFDQQRVVFDTRSGDLAVERQGDLLALDFPSRPPEPCAPPEDLVEGLGVAPAAVLRSRDFMAVYESEETIRRLSPDLERLARVDALGVIVTAPGNSADFVSRFFAPRVGVPEDPVTGSAHCTLIPYWAQRLGKKRLTARQLSARGGELDCEELGARVRIAGRAVTYLIGQIRIPVA